MNGDLLRLNKMYSAFRLADMKYNIQIKIFVVKTKVEIKFDFYIDQNKKKVREQ